MDTNNQISALNFIKNRKILKQYHILRISTFPFDTLIITVQQYFQSVWVVGETQMVRLTTTLLVLSTTCHRHDN